MNVLIIANNLLIQKSPAFGIEQDLLNGIASKGVNITAVCSSVGNSSVASPNYTTIVSNERKSVLYALAAIGKIFPDIMWIPDNTYYSWGIGAKKRAFEIIKARKFDNIHSIGFANASHWVAYGLKKQFGTPWVASFFDSWVDYPTRKFKTSFFKKKDEWMERMVAENADVLVHNNYETAKIWSERYGKTIASKIVVIPFNIDFSKEHPSELNTSNKALLNLNHIGTFYPYRNASSIIKSVKRFTEKYPLNRNRIKVNFVGTVLESDITLIKQYKLDDIFNIVGRISPQECQEYYRNSDVFLSTAGSTQGENVMFPSKIIKYFYYNRPIIGISSVNTITESELVKAGHKSFLPEDEDGFADYINGIIQDYSIACKYDQNYWNRFSNETVIDQYLEVYNKLSH